MRRQTAAMRIKAQSWALGLLLAGTLSAPARANNQGLSFSGRVTNSHGKPLDGPIDISVKFWTASSGGSQLGNAVEFPGTTLLQGVFQLNIVLKPQQMAVVFGDGSNSVFIEVSAAGKVYPRQQFLATPFALRVPTDARTLTYDSNGNLTLSATSQPQDGQFLTKDSGGNLSWGTPSTSATALNNKAVSSQIPAPGQALVFDGSNWTPQTITVGGGGGGSVTNVTGILPIAVSNSTTAPFISIAQASGISSGYLSASDYLSFGNMLSKNGGTMAGVLNMGANTLTNLATPSSASDAATKAYVDTAISSDLKSDGSVALTGPWDVGSQDLTSIGNMALAASKTLGLGTYATDPAGLTATDKGKIWFNTATNQLKYWDGALPQTLGVSGAGLTSLGGQSGSMQTFTTTLTGTAPGLTSSANVHTLNIPLASASGSVTAGLISNTDYLAFNGVSTNTSATVVKRDGSGNFAAGTITASLTGNVTGNVSGSAASVTGIVAPANGGSGVANNAASTFTLSGNFPLTTTLTAATTVTLPTSGTLATLAGTETLTSKTLTAPVISSIVNTGTLTLPTATDTLIGRATIDTLTNKTLTAPVISTISNTGTLTLPTSTDTLVGRATTDNLTNKTLTNPTITGATLTATTLTTTGNVGIGTTTTSGGALSVMGGNVGIGTSAPAALFDVATGAGDIKLQNSVNFMTAGSSSWSGAAYFGVPGNPTGAIEAGLRGGPIPQFGIGMVRDGLGANILMEYGSYMYFRSGTTTRMTLDNHGNLGIGTTAPGTLLEVNGVVHSKTGGFQFPDGTLLTTAPGSGTVTNQTSTTNINFASDSGLTGNAAYNISFSTNGAQRMVVADSGGIGIGTSGPLSALDVNGGIAVGSYAGANAAPSNGLIVSGNVGIGTTAPAVPLDVELASGTGNQSLLRLGVPNVINNNPMIDFNAGTYTVARMKTEYSAISTVGLSFATYNGTLGERMRIDQNGNVGIGTTSPVMSLDVTSSSGASPGKFGGTWPLYLTANYPGVGFNQYWDGAGNMRFGAGPTAYAGGLSFNPNNGSFVLTTSNATGTLGAVATQTTLMTLSQSGNVGIGTSAPVNALDVEGSVRSKGAGGDPGIWIYKGDAAVTNLNWGMIATGNTATGSNIYRLAFGSNNVSGTLAGFSEKMSLTTNGNVGIGTTLPAQILDVVGNGVFGTGSRSSLVRSLNIVNSTDNASIMIKQTGTSGGLFGLYVTGADSTAAFGAAGSLSIFDHNAGATRFTLSSSGNVGIGTISPGYTLDVAGDTRTTGCFKTGAGGTIVGGSCASDVRFKEDITTIKGALSRISVLRPVHYRYRAEEFPGRGFGTELESGFIAQELQNVYPELVVEGDDGYLKVRYGLDLQMETIAAVKELKIEKDKDIAQLKARADKADAEAAQLKADNAQLKAAICSLKSLPICFK